MGGKPMDIKNTIIDILADFSNTCQESISIKTELISLGIDSFKLVELIVFIEDSINITIVDSKLTKENLKTVNDIINIVESTIDIL